MASFKDILKAAEEGNAIAQYNLGLIYRKEGMPDEAKKEFIREVNLNPASRGAWKEIRK